MYYSVLDGILFIEGPHPQARPIRDISVKIHGFAGQAQLKTLDHVKKQMLPKIAKLGGNCLIDFKYGQKSTFWTALVSLDDVSWYSSGTVAWLPPEVTQALIMKKLGL